MEPLQFLTELRAKSQGISPDSRSSDPSRAIRARSLPLAATALPVAARAYCAAMGNPASAARAVSTPVRKSTAPRAPTRSALEGRRPRPRPRPRAQAAAARPTTAHEAAGWSPPLHAHPRPMGAPPGIQPCKGATFRTRVVRPMATRFRSEATGHSRGSCYPEPLGSIALRNFENQPFVAHRCATAANTAAIATAAARPQPITTVADVGHHGCWFGSRKYVVATNGSGITSNARLHANTARRCNKRPFLYAYMNISATPIVGKKRASVAFPGHTSSNGIPLKTSPITKEQFHVLPYFIPISTPHLCAKNHSSFSPSDAMRIVPARHHRAFLLQRSFDEVQVTCRKQATRKT